MGNAKSLPPLPEHLQHFELDSSLEGDVATAPPHYCHFMPSSSSSVDPSSMGLFGLLPDSVLVSIINLLSLQDILNLSTTNRSLFLVCSSDAVWRHQHQTYRWQVDNTLFLYKYVWGLSEPSWPLLPSPDLAHFFPFLSYREYPPSLAIQGPIDGTSLMPFTSLKDFRAMPEGDVLSQCMLECSPWPTLPDVLLERLRITPLPNHAILLGVPEFSLKLLQRIIGTDPVELWKTFHELLCVSYEYCKQVEFEDRTPSGVFGYGAIDFAMEVTHNAMYHMIRQHGIDPTDTLAEAATHVLAVYNAEAAAQGATFDKMTRIRPVCCWKHMFIRRYFTREERLARQPADESSGGAQDGVLDANDPLARMILQQLHIGSGPPTSSSSSSSSAAPQE